MIAKISKFVVEEYPTRNFLAAILLVFGAEGVIMLIIPYFNLVSPSLVAVLDASLLVIFLFPPLYAIIYRPLVRKKTTLEQTENKLRSVVEELAIHQRILQETIQQLETEGRHKSRFVANMSHELRSPLNSMLILSRLLSENREGNLTRKQVEFSDTIHVAGSDLLALIDEVLDLARVEAGRMQLYLDPVQLTEIGAALEQAFQPMAAEKGLAFQIVIDSGLPDCIHTDRQRLFQILKNLVSNAIKFTPQGGIQVVFRPLNPEEHRHSDRSKSNLWCAIDVSDTGIGIPKEQHFGVFQPFRQADDGANRKFQGTGLGLTICQELALFLGGRISIKSEEGKGSLFSVTLPSVSAEAQDKWPDHAAEAAALESGNADLASLRDDRRTLRPHDQSVLVVCGDQKIAQSLCGAAHAEGIKVLVAADEKAALFLADYYQPAAAIVVSGTTDQNEAKLVARLQFGTQTENLPMRLLIPSDHPGTTEVLTRSVQTVPMDATGEPWLATISRFLKTVKADLSLVRKPGAKPVQTKTVECPLAGRRVLIIECDVLNIFSLTSLLQENGASVVIAKTGRDGIKKLKENRVFDLVLVEIMAPDMDGYTLLRRFSEDPPLPSRPVIVVTAKAGPGERQRCLAAGASEYIPKPVDSTKFLSMIKVVLHGHD